MNSYQESTYAAWLGPHTEFLAELEKRLLDSPQKIIIADGALGIGNDFEAFHPTAIQILDFYRAVEKLSSFARVQFRNERRRKQWTARQIQLLGADGVESVIAEVESLSFQGRAKQVSSRTAYPSLIIDAIKNGDVIRNLRVSRVFNRFRAIASAHRNVLHKRLKLSGQRWTQKGLQQVANLRVAYMKSAVEQSRKTHQKRGVKNINFVRPVFIKTRNSLNY